MTVKPSPCTQAITAALFTHIPLDRTRSDADEREADDAFLRCLIKPIDPRRRASAPDECIATPRLDMFCFTVPRSAGLSVSGVLHHTVAMVLLSAL